LLGKIGGMDVVEDDFGVEAFGMRLHARHQIRPDQARGIARPVVHFGRGHQLPAQLQAGQNGGLEVGAGGVDRGGPARGAGTQDDESTMDGHVQMR